MRILIVEDDVKIARALKKGLEQESFAVDLAHDGDAGLAEVDNEDFDLVVLDRMMPGTLDGLGLLKHMRTSGDSTPVIFLTAKDATSDRVEGLNAGADDYLIKPFAFEELLARVKALLRRPPAGNATVIEYEDLKLDTINYQAKRRGRIINLSRKEYAMLEYLMTHPDKILSKEDLRQHVWDFDADILPNTVEAYIGYLRNKIDKPFKAEPLIHTVRGFGYKFGVN